MDGHRFRTYVGIDSSSDKHEVCIVTAGGGLVEGGLVEHSGCGLTSLIEWLSRTAEDGPVRVAVAIGHTVPSWKHLLNAVSRCSR